MELYHFCPAHMLKDILRRGLRLGKFPLMEYSPPRYIDGVQWLTVEPDPLKQSWATSHLIPYSRTAYRLTIKIPDNKLWLLLPATQYIEGLSETNQRTVKDWPGHEDWYVYDGNIPADWIVADEPMQQVTV